MSLPTTAATSNNQPKLGRMARKRLAAAQARYQRELAGAARMESDARTRRSARPPMPRPGSVREHIDGGLTYTLLHWESGKKVGELAGDVAARQARYTQSREAGSRP